MNEVFLELKISFFTFAENNKNESFGFPENLNQIDISPNFPFYAVSGIRPQLPVLSVYHYAQKTLLPPAARLADTRIIAPIIIQYTNLPHSVDATCACKYIQ